MIKHIILLALTVFITASCSKDDMIIFDKSEFDGYKKKWTEADINNYSFQISYFSGTQGPQTAIIIVENGETKSIETTYGNEFFRFNSITDIYNDIENAFAEHKTSLKQEKIKTIRIKIKYNKEYFYPQEVDYSIGYDDGFVGGYYYDYTISNFVINQ